MAPLRILEAYKGCNKNSFQGSFKGSYRGFLLAFVVGCDKHKGFCKGSIRAPIRVPGISALFWIGDVGFRFS